MNNYCISFSGGKSSGMMCIELLRLPEYENAIVCFSNTGKEDEETLKFVNAVDTFIGGRVVWLEYNPNHNGSFNVVSFETASRNGEPFAALIKKRKYVPNRVARFCTSDLKIRTMKKYLQSIGWKHWINLVGIRYDEQNRLSKSKSVTRNEVFDVEHPLAKWKVTKPMVLSYWKAMPFQLNLQEHHGNCDVCFLKGMKKKQKIARENPEKFNWWIDQETGVGGTFLPKITYEQIRDYALRSPEFDFEYDEIDCFCTVD